MIKLTPQSIDDKALYNSIAAKKHKKNDHCSQCQNRTKCDTCEFSNRFKMQSLSNYIFGRYDVYQGQKESLDAIIPENQIAKDDEELLRDAYKKALISRPCGNQLWTAYLEGYRENVHFA